MSLPGFTAANALGAASNRYYGAATLAAAQDESVEPEFLGPIGELFEKIGETFSGAVESLASSVASIISGLRDSGGGGGQPFVCGQWATRMIACSGNSPAYSEAEMLGACASTNPLQIAACGTATAAMYPLVQKACQDNPGAVGQLVGQVCQGG
jgi:hypothetical protein